MYYLKTRKSLLGLEWEMRAGIHAGKVIGGVVGLKKYLYDIFGKTVNIAARMEQYSEASKINVSEEVKIILQNDFDFEKRPLINVKGLGEMQMYFLKYKI
jgi:class 3 adenylate cyclase